MNRQIWGYKPMKNYEKLPLTPTIFLKSILIICFILYTISLYIILQNPTTGYEISIYSYTPFTFWLFQMIAISAGICILVYLISLKNIYSCWKFCLLLLLLCNFSITALHSLKGYYLYNPVDSAAHVGIIKDIIMNDHINSTNYNPLTHILVAQLTHICNLSITTIVGYIPSYYTILSVLFIYILSKIVLQTKAEAILSSTLAAIIFFYGSIHSSFYPQGMSMELYPLLFYSFFKSRDLIVGHKIVYILLIICYPFMHFIPNIAIIFLLLLSEITFIVYTKKYTPKLQKEIVSTKPILISVIISFMWFSYFVFFSQGIRRLMLWLQGEIIYVPQGAQTSSLFQYLGLYNAFEILLRAYGDNLTYIIISMFALILIWNNIHANPNPKMKNIVVVSVLFLAAIPLHIVLLLAVAQASLGRFLNLNLIMWITPVLAGYTLHRIIKQKKILNNFIICLFLISICTVSVMGMYQSPFLLSSNLQVTYESVQGVNWFFETKNENLLFGAMGTTNALFGAVFGSNESLRKDIYMSFNQLLNNRNESLPSHFNYVNNNRYGQFFRENTYLIVDQQFKQIISNDDLREKTVTARPIFFDNIDENDFIALNRDGSVSKIYSNGEFETFYVIAT